MRYLCPPDKFLLREECIDTMSVYYFNATGAGYLTASVASLLDNNPQTEGAYEMWIWPSLAFEDCYLF